MVSAVAYVGFAQGDDAGAALGFVLEVSYIVFVRAAAYCAK